MPRPGVSLQVTQVRTVHTGPIGQGTSFPPQAHGLGATKTDVR
jgi:hypothetical protein